MANSSKHAGTPQKKNFGLKDQKTTLFILLGVLGVILVVVVIIALKSCNGSGDNGSGGNGSGYVPETQDGTTILSTYYVDGILPTGSDRHDEQVINGGGANVADLYGVWNMIGIEGKTVYEFDGQGRGIILTDVDNYTFIYSAENGELIIDIDTVKGEDTKYQYTINGSRLTITEGSSKYEFERQDIQ